MADLAKVAKEILQIMQTFDYTVKLYNDEDMRVFEPEEARRFFDRSKNLEVAILDDGDNSAIELSFGKSTHANDIMGLDDALKTVATKFSLIFSAKQFSKQIKPKDVTALGSVTEKQDRKMILSLTEGMYGTTRSSYLRLEHARMVVRHSKKINDSMIGARGRCVESIFIENDSGERLLFPSTQLAPARAMAQHVNQGGVFTDSVGDQIMHMTNEYSNLSQASNYVANNQVNLSEGAMLVREACRGKMRNLRKTFEKLSKHSSYMREAQTVMECAKSLKEDDAAIVETRLSELRQLLNGADLPKEVYECASKAMAEMKEAAPITEAKPADDSLDYVPDLATTEGVLGYRVDKTAWKQLSRGIIVVTGPPKKEVDPKFPDQFTKLCYNVGKWVPVIADVTLANLLSNIVDKMMNYKATQEIPNDGIRMDVSREEEWKKRLSTMATIAVKAMKARKVRVKKTEDFGAGAGVPAVAEHFSWLGKFDPEQILAEDFGGMGDWGDPIGDGYQDTKHELIANFQAEEFANSPEVHEVVGDKQATNPEENHLTDDEVMTALRGYVSRQMKAVDATSSMSIYMTDIDDDAEIADSLYDEACEALQDAGWIVDHAGNMEMVESDEFDDNGLELNSDDIMMPTPNQGNSLIKQVSKAAVHDPDHPHVERKPDSGYIDRLMALAGVRGGGQVERTVY